MTDYRQRVHQRMDELAALQPGWLDGDGAALGPALLATAAVIAESTAQWAGEIGIYPTPEGGVQLEWSDAWAAHSITIGPDLRTTMTTVDRGEAERSDPHHYLSTGCLHGRHAYCQGKTGQAGAKVPARCKFCPATCSCDCHHTTEQP